jgi:hypothetical protein
MLPPLNRMELGFFETNINDREVIAHLGDTEYFHTSLHLFLKENVGFYVSFNSLGKEGAADGLRTALFQDFADRYFPVAPVTTRVDEKTAREHAAMLTGTWVNSRGSKSNFIAVLGLVSQLKVGMDKKGELVTPGINALDGKPRHWVEVTPFLWIDSASHDRLAAKIVDGKAVRWSFDLLSPFMVFERVPWYANNTWLKPLLVVSLAALLLTAVLWPVTAVIRRRYRAPLALDPESLKAYRLSKIGAIAILAGLLLWVLVFSTLLKASGDVSDALIWLAEIVGTILFIGGLVLMLWNLRAVWLGARRWPAKVWSIVLTVSALTVLWAAVVGKLISFGANY